MTRVIELVPHDPSWAEQFEAEALKLKDIIKGNCSAIYHIGSTAILGIYAKPVIDILAVVNDLEIIDDLNPSFEVLGYECMGEFGIPGRRFYWKSKSKRTHHIHLFEKGNAEIKRHLAFKDYLLQHPDTAQGYSWIKRCLAEQFVKNVAAYVNGKDSFVRAIDYHAGVAKPDQLEAKDDIVIVPYDTDWPKLAVAEINAIKHFVDLPYVAIAHLGSTSVEGLSAKPIIDIFVALENMDQVDQWNIPLQALGYIDWPDNPDKTHARFFKGMPPFGVRRTHHLHIMPAGEAFNRRVAFRNLLRRDGGLRQRYEVLKQELATRCTNDREAYTSAKADFVRAGLNR